MGYNLPLLQQLDAIAADGISKGAAPGMVVLVAKNGNIIYQHSYGYTTYANLKPVSLNSVFDMASVTKICATTLAIMKLYDEGKIKLTDTLGQYIPWVRGTNKAGLTISNILLHQAGLKSYIPFYKEVIDVAGNPLQSIFAKQPNALYTIPVADSMYMLTSYIDTMYHRIVTSKLEKPNKYLYSDNDFIFLGLIVEAVSKQTLDQYVLQQFYEPLGLQRTGYLPLTFTSMQTIIPTEDEKIFRQQTLQGYVHDPGAAMLGGVAGHAGLYSTAPELAVIMQMLLNSGSYGGKQYFKPATVTLFTSYQSAVSRRGFGFDKPEKDNATRKEAYPCISISPQAFGHTGYTGTCVWADPAEQLIFILLTNRVYPQGGDNTTLQKLNIRGRMQDAVYRAKQ